MSDRLTFIALLTGSGLVTACVAALLEGRGYLVVEWVRGRLGE